MTNFANQLCLGEFNQGSVEKDSMLSCAYNKPSTTLMLDMGKRVLGGAAAVLESSDGYLAS